MDVHRLLLSVEAGCDVLICINDHFSLRFSDRLSFARILCFGSFSVRNASSISLSQTRLEDLHLNRVICPISSLRSILHTGLYISCISLY